MQKHESLVSTAPKNKPALWGLLGEYGDAEALKAAAASVFSAGYKRWDCHTPFPVHGLDRAMGVRPTILPRLVFAGGLTGCLIAIFMQWYCNSPLTANLAGGLSGYPLVFGGKPYWSLPANIPIAFELSVLFAALTAFFGLWALVGLPRFYFPAFASRRFRKVTDDGFVIIIKAADIQFDPVKTKEFLLSTGCIAVEEIMD